MGLFYFLRHFIIFIVLIVFIVFIVFIIFIIFIIFNIFFWSGERSLRSTSFAAFFTLKLFSIMQNKAQKNYVLNL